MDLLKDDRLLPLAAKYASRLGRVHLADKLTNMAEAWKEEQTTVKNTHFEVLDAQETYDVANAEELNKSIILPFKGRDKDVEVINDIKPAVSKYYYMFLMLD